MSSMGTNGPPLGDCEEPAVRGEARQRREGHSGSPRSATPVRPSPSAQTPECDAPHSCGNGPSLGLGQPSLEKITTITLGPPYSFTRGPLLECGGSRHPQEEGAVATRRSSPASLAQQCGVDSRTRGTLRPLGVPCHRCLRSAN